MHRFICVLAALVPFSTAAQDAIVSIGGPVTEIIYALDQQDRIVARDTTSTYPAAANALPDVGYLRALSAEGVLSVGPDLIITRDTAGPPEVLEQLDAAAVPLVKVKDGFSAQSVIDAIHTVGTALDQETAATALAETVDAQFSTLAEQRAAITTPVRAMFVLSNQGGRLNIAGLGTGADGIINLSGAVNVMADEFHGYKIMNDEAIIAAAPDVVIMMTSRGDHSGAKDDILSLPSLAQTPAGENGGFVLIDGAALGFGPRTAEFAMTLLGDLYPSVKSEH